MVDIRDDVVSHETMNDAEKCILKIGRRIEVTSKGDTMLCCEDGMGRVGPHNAVTQKAMNEKRNIIFKNEGPTTEYPWKDRPPRRSNVHCPLARCRHPSIHLPRESLQNLDTARCLQSHICRG